MKASAARALTTLIAVLVCAVAAASLPPLWQGVSGRDFRPQATAMAVLVFVCGVAARRWLRWSVVDFSLGLFLVEVTTLMVIATFSGYTWLAILDSFNLPWLGFMNLFTGLPWLVGLLIGSVWLQLHARHERTAQPAATAARGRER